MSSNEIPQYMVPDIGRAVVDVETAWNARMDQAMRQGSLICALRGPGTVGGIDPHGARNVLDEHLAPMIEEGLSTGPVAIIYDGDGDDPANPDIGYLFGRLVDQFGTMGEHGVSMLAAQADDWYGYADDYGGLRQQGDNLTNAHGLPIETFVFPRGVYPGDHNHFTQSQALARYGRYRQIYVGASGMIAAEQMQDYFEKASSEDMVNITVIRALINQARSIDISEQLAQAATDAQREKLQRMQQQRRRVFGLHWRNDGSFDTQALADLRAGRETHELIALWDGPDKVEIVNCQKIDLNSPTVNMLFRSARQYVKTQPIHARQVPEGTSETILVNSGATRDIAQGGDWVCVSPGTNEEYVVHQGDFNHIYEYVEGSGTMFKPKWDPRKLVRLDRDVAFMAPWGEQQAVRRDGYLIERTIRYGERAGQTERYGISQRDADIDFEPI